VFVALPDAFVFNTEIVVDVAAHEMNSWQGKGFFAVAAGVCIEVLRASLHLLDVLSHLTNILLRDCDLFVQLHDGFLLLFKS